MSDYLPDKARAAGNAAGSGTEAWPCFKEELAMASFSVVTNIASVNAQANLYATNLGLKQALTRVSSGFRINYSGDDAAGLAVANAYRSKVAVITQGVRNANDALSDLQIKDGALDNISKLLDRMATLATQAATSTAAVGSQRTTLNAEFQDIVNEIGRELSVASLNQVGAFSVFVSNETTSTNGVSDGIVRGTITPLSTDGAGGTTSLDLNNLSLVTDPATAVTRVSAAITILGTTQGEVGQVQNRLSYAISLAQSQIVNTRAAESRIRDANIAEESANLTRYSILNQSGLAALSQANQSTSAVLSLLR
jgi:flagellin